MTDVDRAEVERKSVGWKDNPSSGIAAIAITAATHDRSQRLNVTATFDEELSSLRLIVTLTYGS